MTVFFVSRHQGAIEWMKKQPVKVDCWKDDLNIDTISAGDTVIGTVPIHLAAQICVKGAVFLALQLELPVDLRGTELTNNQLKQLNCKLCRYEVNRLPFESPS